MKTVVITRESKGGTIDYRPVRVYLLSCATDESGAPIIPQQATKAQACAFVVENKKATARMRKLLEKANLLAAKVNSGELTFELAAERFCA
jgi:hypothetical protein